MLWVDCPGVAACAATPGFETNPLRGKRRICSPVNDCPWGKGVNIRQAWGTPGIPTGFCSKARGWTAKRTYPGFWRAHPPTPTGICSRGGDDDLKP